MKRIILSLILLGLHAPVFAQEAETVREDRLLVQKEIAVWRTDKAGFGKTSVYSCQAVRLSPGWFLTAAHCVYNACRDSLPCTVQINLAQAEGDLRQTVRVNHSTTAKNVFIYEGFFPGQNRISSVDVALIKLDDSVQYFYQAWNEKTQSWESISQAQFDKASKYSPEINAQLNSMGPLLVGAANLPTAKFLPTLVVPLLTEGMLTYLVAPSSEVFFVKELQHFISPGFGVQRGNSGGGVFTANGALVGLVSSVLYGRDGSASFRNDEGKTVLTLKNASDYFLFTGFNGSTLNFIRNHVPDVRVVGAENGFIEPTEKDFNAIVKSISRSFMALE